MPIVANIGRSDRTDRRSNENSQEMIAFLALTVWVAHFCYFRYFGLYEDDDALVSPAFGWSLSDLFDHAANVSVTWPQGRPLNFLLPQFFSFVATQ